MSGSERSRRAWRGCPPLGLALVGLLVAGGARGLQAQFPSPVRVLPVTVTVAGGTLAPGRGPVVVAPWSLGGLGQPSAAIFELRGAPDQLVTLRPTVLPDEIMGPGGAVVQVRAYTLAFSPTPNGAMGDQLRCRLGETVTVRLDRTGVGYVSLGATYVGTGLTSSGAYRAPDGVLIAVQ